MKYVCIKATSYKLVKAIMMIPPDPDLVSINHHGQLIINPATSREKKRPINMKKTPSNHGDI